jgi:hypothetical protein
MAELCSIEGEHCLFDLDFNSDGEITVQVYSDGDFDYFTTDNVRALYEAMKEYFEGEGGARGQETDV